MARDQASLGGLAADSRWQPIRTDPRIAVWTDDFSSLVSVIAWR
jgi:hypothetical protein